METEIRIKTQGGRYLARGIRFDPEDSRMTARLHAAYGILKAAGIEPTFTHSTHTVVEYGRQKHECNHHCVTEWPEWVTGEMFDSAYTLADTAIRGKANWVRRHFHFDS